MPDSQRPARRSAEEVGRVAGRLFVGVLVFYFVIWIVFKGTWELLVPSLFPGAVDQGLVARTISWWTAFLLSGAATLVLLWSRWVTNSWPSSAGDRLALVEAKLNAVAAHLGIDLDAAVLAEVAALAAAGKKVQAIALYRRHTGADLASAKAYVDGGPGA